jgi:nucleoside phosphorylase
MAAPPAPTRSPVLSAEVLNTGGLKTKFAGAESKLRTRIVKDLNAFTMLTASRLKAKAPRGGTSGLVNGIHAVPGTVANPTTSIVSTAKYTGWVKEGTKPHPVSAEGQAAIAQWAKRKGIPASAVGAIIWGPNGIVHKGTKANNFIDPIIEPAKAEAVRIMKASLEVLKL